MTSYKEMFYVIVEAKYYMSTEHFDI